MEPLTLIVMVVILEYYNKQILFHPDKIIIEQVQKSYNCTNKQFVVVTDDKIEKDRVMEVWGSSNDDAHTSLLSLQIRISKVIKNVNSIIIHSHAILPISSCSRLALSATGSGNRMGSPRRRAFLGRGKAVEWMKFCE